MELKDDIGRNIKVIFITPYMITGGTEKVIFDLASGLLNKKYKVWICSSGGYLIAALENKGVKKILIGELCSKNPFKILFSIRKLAKIIKNEDFDIINSHSYIISIIVAISKKMANSKAKHIFTLHIPERKWVFPLIGKTSSLINDHSTTVCNKNRDKLILYGLSPSKIQTIYNGIDIEMFASKRKQKASDTLFNIAIVARLIERKGHKYLLQAVRNLVYNFKITNIFLNIIGSGPLEEKIKKMICDFKIDKFVKMFGDCKDVEMLLKNMDIFVLPSLYEGFPVSILEAMSSELPIIATNVDGIPEIIKNGETGILITPKNSASIENAIISLIQNKLLRKRLGENGRKYIEKNFSKASMINSYEKMFKDLLT